MGCVALSSIGNHNIVPNTTYILLQAKI